MRRTLYFLALVVMVISLCETTTAMPKHAKRVLAPSNRLTPAAIDSQQWLFPDTINISAIVNGRFRRDEHQDHPPHGVPMDTTWDEEMSAGAGQVPLYMPLLFGYQDAVGTADTFVFTRSGNFQTITARFELDTNLHTARMTYAEDMTLESNQSRFHFALQDIPYSRTGLSFPDHNVNRHLSGLELTTSSGLHYQYGGARLEALHEFIIFGDTLRVTLVYDLALNFGIRDRATSVDTTIILKNLDTRPVEIFQYQLSGDTDAYTLLDTLSHHIPAQDSIRIGVRYTTVGVRESVGHLTCVTDEAASSQRIITLAGSVAYSQLTMPYDIPVFTTDTGTSISIRVPIRNQGNVSASIDSVFIRGDAQFRIDSPATAFAASAGKDANVKVTFAPHRIGHFVDTLVVFDSGKVCASTIIVGEGTATPSGVFGGYPQSIMSNEIAVYPVIADRYVSIALAHPSTRLFVINALGETCLSITQANRDQTHFNLDTSKLTTGSYIVRTTTGHEAKFVVRR
ncbi:MAG: hypothetical protein ABI444_11815 [Candidatus Kapaibacterium sp.]